MIRSDDITKWDVKCGRGYSSYSYNGNQLLLAICHSRFPEYTEASKARKVEISREVVKQIKEEHGGRFLEKDADFDCWFEIIDQQARMKVAQKMRECMLREQRRAPRQIRRTDNNGVIPSSNCSGQRKKAKSSCTLFKRKSGEFPARVSPTFSVRTAVERPGQDDVGRLQVPLLALTQVAEDTFVNDSLGTDVDASTHTPSLSDPSQMLARITNYDVAAASDFCDSTSHLLHGASTCLNEGMTSDVCLGTETAAEHPGSDDVSSALAEDESTLADLLSLIDSLSLPDLRAKPSGATGGNSESTQRQHHSSMELLGKMTKSEQDDDMLECVAENLNRLARSHVEHRGGHVRALLTPVSSVENAIREPSQEDCDGLQVRRLASTQVSGAECIMYDLFDIANETPIHSPRLGDLPSKMFARSTNYDVVIAASDFRNTTPHLLHGALTCSNEGMTSDVCLGAETAAEHPGSDDVSSVLADESPLADLLSLIDCLSESEDVLSEFDSFFHDELVAKESDPAGIQGR